VCSLSHVITVSLCSQSSCLSEHSLNFVPWLVSTAVTIVYVRSFPISSTQWRARVCRIDRVRGYGVTLQYIIRFMIYFFATIVKKFVIRNETRISENRLIASIFASMMANFYGNIVNLFTFTFDFNSQLRLVGCIIKIAYLISPKFIESVFKNTN